MNLYYRMSGRFELQVSSSELEHKCHSHALSSRTGHSIITELTCRTFSSLYSTCCRATHLHSEPQEKLPTSRRSARYFLFPPRTLTVWMRLGPSWKEIKWINLKEQKYIKSNHTISVSMCQCNYDRSQHRKVQSFDQNGQIQTDLRTCLHHSHGHHADHHDNGWQWQLIQ